MPPRHQGFCFTHNNFKEEDIDRYKKLFETGYFKYLLWGQETAPNTGTPHLQGFFWTSELKQLAHVKKKLTGAWIAVPGSDKGPEYWLDYCTKQDSDPVILGPPPSEEEFQAQAKKGQGKRTDLIVIKHKIDEGVMCDTLMEDDKHFTTFAGHMKFFHHYQSYKRRRTEFRIPNVIVYHGSTGTNKTKRAYDAFWGNLEELHKWSPQHGQWFDGYCGQKTVLFDEFRGQLPYGMLLDLLDGYPSKVQVKNGMVHWSPETIYFSSPEHPKSWYNNLSSNDKISQLMRRITTIIDTTPLESHDD